MIDDLLIVVRSLAHASTAVSLSIPKAARPDGPYMLQRHSSPDFSSDILRRQRLYPDKLGTHRFGVGDFARQVAREGRVGAIGEARAEAVQLYEEAALEGPAWPRAPAWEDAREGEPRQQNEPQEEAKVGKVEELERLSTPQWRLRAVLAYL